MADKFRLGSEVRELKIGQSFTNPKSSGFHTIKYDFKPASVDTNKIATVDVGGNHQVTLTVPHLDGAGVPQTVFKGSQRPYQKECVLIIDRTTGEVTLERLSSNITVKKTRSESAKPQLPQDKLSQGSDKSSISSRSLTPPIVGQRISNRTKVTSGSRRPDRPITQLVQRHSPLQASPSYPPPPLKSPKNTNSNHNSGNDYINMNNHSTLASLPLIDDYVEPYHMNSSSSHSTVSQLVNSNVSPSLPNAMHLSQHHSLPPPPPPSQQRHNSETSENGVGEMSNSSSSSSSDSDSDSEQESTVLERTPINRTNGHMGNGLQNSSSQSSFNRMSATSNIPTAARLLNEDLCLSESGSDSD